MYGSNLVKVVTFWKNVTTLFDWISRAATTTWPTGDIKSNQNERGTNWGARFFLWKITFSVNSRAISVIGDFPIRSPSWKKNNEKHMFGFQQRAFLLELLEIPNITSDETSRTLKSFRKKVVTVLQFDTFRTLEILKYTCDSFWCSPPKTNCSCGPALSGHATRPFSLPMTCSEKKSTVFSSRLDRFSEARKPPKIRNLTGLGRLFKKGNRISRAREPLVSELTCRESIPRSLGKLIFSTKTVPKSSKFKW